MLFEQYKESEYERKKLEVQLESRTPKTVFINAYQIELQFKDVIPYVEDEDRKIPTSILKLIVYYCTVMARSWKIDSKFYGNHEEIKETPSNEFTHTFFLIQFLDEWCLNIYSTETKIIYSYAISKQAQHSMEKIFKEKKLQVEQITKLNQPMTIAEADTVVMIKLMYQICKEQTLKVVLDPKLAQEWGKQIRIVDLFLFELHRKQKEQIINKSQQSQQSKQLQISRESKIEFKPDLSQIGEAPSLNKSKKLAPIPSKASFDKSLSQSAYQHGQIDAEMIEFTKDEFLSLIDRFKTEVIAELQQIKPEHPTEFMKKFLKGNGELKVVKDKRGKEQLVVNMKGEQLQVLMQQYEKYYQQKINEQEYEKQKAEAEQQYQTFLQFQQLLNYYYQYDPAKYQQLVNEYYARLNEQTLKKLGFKQENNQENPPQQFNQSQDYLSAPSPQQKQLSFSKSTDRYQQKINQTASQPSFNISRVQNISSLNKNQISSSFAENPEFQPSPQNSVVSYRYQKSITQAEIYQLQYKGEMTENMLNFYIRYLQEKQTFQQQNTLKQLRNRNFYLSTTFYRALVQGYNNPDQISYQSASFYTQQYLGKDNTIFDKFDKVLIPIIVAKGQETILININLAKQTIIFYDTLLNGVGSQSMAKAQVAQTGLLNNPFLLCCLRFLEMEHNQKLMKPLSLLKWQIYYSPHEKLKDNKQTNVLIALLLTQITKGIEIDKNFTIQLELAQFISKLVQLFSSIGITQNRHNEVIFEKMPL